jgi:hypothetical protein
MKHLKEFKIFESTLETNLPEGLLKILNKSVNGTWKINPQTGKIDVDGDLKMVEVRPFQKPQSGGPISKDLKELFGGFEIGKVTGKYECGRVSTYSLEGGPEYVGGDFSVWQNRSIKEMKGCPSFVGGNFEYSSEECILNLKGSPDVVKGDYTYRYGGHRQCFLSSLKGLTPEIGGTLTITDFEELGGGYINSPSKKTKMDFSSFCESMSKSFMYWTALEDERFFDKYFLPNLKKSPNTLIEKISIKDFLTSPYFSHRDPTYENTKFYKCLTNPMRKAILNVFKPLSKDEETIKLIEEYEYEVKKEYHIDKVKRIEGLY